MKELDSVVATCSMDGVPVGTKGVIVYDYQEGKAYEVEFFINGTSEVLLVAPSQIKKDE